jgi:hypothetical protein
MMAPYRLHRAERARVGEGHGGPGEIVGRDLLGVDLADQVFVGHHEGPEVEAVGSADDRHEQRPGTVALGQVDGQTQTDVVMADHPGRALLVDGVHKGGVERRHGLQGLHHGISDQMGEADLGPRRPGQVLIQDRPVDLEKFGRHRPHAGGGGNGQ